MLKDRISVRQTRRELFSKNNFSRDHLDSLIALRQKFHRSPELSGSEVETSHEIWRLLLNIGIQKEDIDLGCGVVATIHGRDGGPIVMVRSPIDALPIQEELDLPFRSINAGVMHACGHDAGIAVLIVLAEILMERRNSWSGTIRLVFQPGEETLTGINAMLNANQICLHDVSALVSFHLSPSLPSGKIGVAKYTLFAGVENFEVKLSGEGGHVSAQYLANDALAAACEAVSRIPALLKRVVNPMHPAIVVPCQMKAGSANNVIANHANFAGTLRYFDDQVRSQIKRELQKLVDGIASEFGMSSTFTWTQHIPPLVNDKALLAATCSMLADIVDEQDIVEVSPSLAADDVSILHEKVPAVYMLIGSGKPGVNSKLHTATFYFSDQVLVNALDSVFKIVVGLAQ